MAETTVSSKYQVVIPKAVRERLSVKPGQKLSVVVRGNIIALVPQVAPEDLRGFLKGMDPSGLREKGDRV